MPGTDNSPEFIHEIQKGNFRIQVNMKPLMEKLPDLISHGNLLVRRCEINQDGSCSLGLLLSRTQSLVELKEAAIKIGTENYPFHASVDRGCVETMIRIPKFTEESFKVKGELAIEILRKNLISQYVAMQYNYTFAIEVYASNLNRVSQEQRPNLRSINVPPSKTVSSYFKNPEEPVSKIQPKSPARESIPAMVGNQEVLYEIQKIHSLLQNFQQVEAQSQQRFQKISERLESIESKLQSVIQTVSQTTTQSVPSGMDMELKGYTDEVQKQFQAQAKKKVNQAKKLLTPFASDPIIQAIDRMQAVLHRDAASVLRLIELSDTVESTIRDLAEDLDAFRQRLLPDANFDLPDFIYNKDYSQFMRSEYRLFLQKTVSCDREPSDSLLDPKQIYKIMVWKEFKRILDEFAPAYQPSPDWEQRKIEWDRYFLNSFLLRLRNVEKIEESFSWNPAVTQRMNEWITAILDPLELEILPVEIGENFDPRKHDKDPHRSNDKSSLVSRIFHRGMQRKNQGGVLVMAKVSVG